MVNRMNDQIVSSIHDASICVAGLSTDKPKQLKQRPWWTASTKLAKNRKSLWYSIWKSCDKPRAGYVYICYKLAKTKYRQACRMAFNTRNANSFRTLNTLYRTQDSKQFWKIVRKRRRNCNDPSSDIELQTLVNYYTDKFAPPTVTSDIITASQEYIREKQEKRFVYNTRISCSAVVRYIRALKLGCSPAGDGIESEHLRYGIETQIPMHISNMLSLCIRYSVVPDSFTNGLLIPIPKKSGCDTSVPKNWRPIIISTTLSKLMEMYILEESSGHIFSDSQFGFVSGRGTEIATALVNDVISYANVRGSTVYTCSLDAEGAFDAIPHCVLFKKASEVLPDYCWHVMVNWYEKLTVQIKWCKQLSVKISVYIGTRQGGISSPLLFNIFYQELVDALSKCPGGISINNDSFNVFCYADDLILTSLSVTGLQELIDTASSYIIAHGLKFNASKTICTSLGANHFETTPEWHLNGSVLREEAAVTYLGTVLSSNPKLHFDTRIKSATRAFYGLQCAGLCAGGVAPTVSAHMFNVAIQPILTYGCTTLNFTLSSVKELDKVQAKLLKSALGLPKFCHNTPLLQALKVKKIDNLLQVQQLSLIRNALLNNSKARTFYLHMFKHRTSYTDKNLLSRCLEICNTHRVSLTRYVFDEHYASKCKRQIYAVPQDGVVDSIRSLLYNYNQHSKQLVKLLLSPFQ